MLWLGVLIGALAGAFVTYQFMELRRETTEYRAQEARNRDWDREHGIDAGGM